MREWLTVLKVIGPIVLIAPIGIPLLIGYDLYRKNKEKQNNKE